MKGVVYRENDDTAWQGLFDLQARIRDHMGSLGLELILDESEGHAYLRQRPRAEDEPELPRLVARRPLGSTVSLLLALPHAQSFLMDRATVLAHRSVWGEERDNERHLAPLARLTPDETALYEDLVANRLADRLRLEQERISFRWLRHALALFNP